VAEPIHWTEISPSDAVELTLPDEGVTGGPLNENGVPCPWPWEPQQMIGAPLGQYHCGYCGAMVMAGLPHIDYNDAKDGPEQSDV
jgi:hypothetical protein